MKVRATSHDDDDDDYVREHAFAAFSNVRWSRLMASNSGASITVDPHHFRSFCFRGEGRANCVISAKCAATGVRVAWRLAKDRKTGFISDEQKSQLVITYWEKLIMPVIGRMFLEKPTVVNIDVVSLHHIAKVLSFPLGYKVQHFHEFYNPTYKSLSFFKIPPRKSIRYVSALQMNDATRISKQLDLKYLGPTITVEIKPKQGFMQEHPGLNVPYCNNCILQLEKCHTKAFDVMYDFCPLDLFSGDIIRMRKALKSLFLVPHRNLRVFISGDLVYCDEYQNEGFDEILQRSAKISIEQLITALCCVLAGAPSNECFSMSDSSVLSKLLQGQRIDTIGIVRAHQIYSALPEAVKKELLDENILAQKGLSIMKEKSDRALIERYLLAATMKDCSLMISVRAVELSASQVLSSSSLAERVILLSTVNNSSSDKPSVPTKSAFEYAITIVDLDPKSPNNLLHAYERFKRGIDLIQRTPFLRRPCIS